MVVKELQNVNVLFDRWVFCLMHFVSAGYIGDHYWQQQPCSLEVCSAHRSGNGMAAEHCCESTCCYRQGVGGDIPQVQQRNVSFANEKIPAEIIFK